MPRKPPKSDEPLTPEQQKANEAIADSFAEQLGFGEQPHPSAAAREDRLFAQALERVPGIAKLIVRAMKKEITREEARELAKPLIEQLKQEYRKLAEDD